MFDCGQCERISTALICMCDKLGKEPQMASLVRCVCCGELVPLDKADGYTHTLPNGDIQTDYYCQECNSDKPDHD